MTIGFDIDNTITNSKECAIRYYRKYISNGQKGDMYFENEKKKQKFFDKYLLDILREVTIKDNVIDVFNYLKENNHKIILITKRCFNEPEEIKELTLKYLEENKLIYDKIYFKVQNKGLIAKNEGINIFFDDHVDNLESLKNSGIKAIKFGDKEKDFENVESWNELLDYIKKEGF